MTSIPRSPSTPFAAGFALSMPQGQDRWRLFRRSRASVAGVLLVSIVPLLAFTDTSAALVAAMGLMALLPLAIALDTHRTTRLPRALGMALLAGTVAAMAAILKGLPLMAAAMITGGLALELIVLGGRRRVSANAFGAVASFSALGAVSASGWIDGAGAETAWAGWACVTAAIAGILSLGLGQIASLAKRLKSATDRLAGLRGEAAVSDEVLLTMESAGGVSRIGGCASQVLGLDDVALLGRGLLELTLVSDRPLVLSAVAAPASGDLFRTVRFRLRQSPKSETPRYRWVEARIAASRSQLGRTIVALRDIDMRVNDEIRAEQAMAEAAEAKQARGAFLSTLNHELRTPLNAVIGFAEVMANPMTRPADPERIGEYAGLIHGAGKDLLRNITAMIDLTRLESGLYDFETEAADLRTTVKTVIEMATEQSQGATIRTSLPAAPIEIAHDARALSSALSEVITNALKHAPKASVIRVGLRSDNHAVYLSVTDDGPGIRSDRLARIDQQFGRLDEGLVREHGGLGVGLELVARLMALHNGKVTVESEWQRGTVVTLSLPLDTSLPTNVRRLSPTRTATAPVAPAILSLQQDLERRHA